MVSVTNIKTITRKGRKPSTNIRDPERRNINTRRVTTDRRGGYKFCFTNECSLTGQRSCTYWNRCRSAVEEWNKAVEENGEENLSYVADRSGRHGKSLEEGPAEYETSCPKRSAKSCSKGGRKKTCYVMVGEESGAAEAPKTKKHQVRKEIDASSAVSAKKTKNTKKRQSYVIVEEPEATPADVEYRLVVNKKSVKEKKAVPAYVYVDESGQEGAAAAAEDFTGKTLKKKSANYILEGMDENEVENRTGRRYVIEEIIEETPEEGDGMDGEENETL